VIPSEDEWYKAAYHYNDGVTGNYWNYPTASDTAPTSEAPPGTDMTNGSANCYDGDYAIGSPYYRTEVGAYVAKPSDSPYGTFDQGGNVWEWNEAVVYVTYRGLRGGSFNSYGYFLHASERYDGFPTVESADLGFRVAEVPEPACALLGDVDDSGTVNGADIAGFIRVKLDTPAPGDVETCADYGTGTLEGDIAAFVADLLG
jgi:formylglycine-generating enzyme required for sulfatase activity